MPLFTAIGIGVATGFGLTAAVGTAAATGAVVAGGTLALTAAGTFVAGATAFGLQIAAGIGLNLLAQQFAGQPSQVAAPAAGPGFSVQGKLSSGADQPRSFAMGYRATAGSLVWANTWGDENKTPNSFVTQVITLSDLPLRPDDEGLVGLWVNGKRCTIEWDDPHPIRGYPVTEFRAGGDHEPYLWIRYHDGTQTEADQLCVTKARSAQRPYASTRVGTGIAYVVTTALVRDSLFTGFPQFKFEVSGIKLYDPSKDSSVGGSGSQRYNNPATWGGDGDDLPAVQIYNLLRGISYDGAWLYGLQAASASRVPAAHWIAQINKCRASVDSPGGGTEPKYRSSIEVFVNNDLASTIEALLTACQGKLTETGGVYKLYCGAPGEPVMSFTDADILSTEEQSFTPFFGLSDTVNGISARYPSPDDGWNTQAAPPIYRPDLEAKAGNRRLMSDVSLDTVYSPRQVQQLMRESLQEAQRARRHTIALPPKFWPLEPGDIVSWSSERNGYTDKLFRVDGVVDKANLDVLIDLTEVDASDYDWTIGDYVTPLPGPGDPGFVEVDEQAVTGFAVTGIIVTDESGAIKRPAIKVEWEAEGLVDITGIQIQCRKAAAPSEIIIDLTAPDFALGYCILQAGGILPATDYEVRGRFVPGGRRETTWTTWHPVTTPDTRFEFADLSVVMNDALTNQLRAELEELRSTLEQVAASSLDRVGQTWGEYERQKNALRVAKGNLSASIETVETVVATNEAALADLATTVEAHGNSIDGLTGDVTDIGATVTSHSSALASQSGSIATLESTVSSHTSGITSLSASVTTQATAITGINGALSATYQIKLDAGNNAISGIKLYQGAEISAFIVSADFFQIWKSGFTAQPVFEVGTVNGAAAMKLRGNFYGDGDIITRHISANSIETNHLKAEAATALFCATGADISGAVGDRISSGRTLTSVTVNIVNGECLVMFDADVTAEQGGGSQSDSITLDVRIGSTTLFTRTYPSIVTDGDARIRYPVSFSRVVNITPGNGQTLSVVVAASNFANSKSTLRGPTVTLLESRR